MGTAGEDDSEASVYTLSSSMHLFLSGWELGDTLLVLTPDKLFVLGSDKKCALFEGILNEDGTTDENQFPIEIMRKDKKDGNNENFNVLLSEMRSYGTKMGWFKKENFNGKFLSSFLMKSESLMFETVDISLGISNMMVLKDAEERNTLKKASVLTNKVMKHNLFSMIDSFIQDEFPKKGNEEVTGSLISSKVEEVISDPRSINNKVNPVNVDSCFTPFVDSGSQVDLKLSSTPTENPLTKDVISASMGIRYKSYCSYIARSFMVSPTKAVEEAYLSVIWLLEEFVKLLEEIGEDEKLTYADVTTKLREKLKEQSPHLLPYLTKSLGSSTGIEFKNSYHVFNSRCDSLISRDSCFVLMIGLENVPLVTSTLKGEEEEEEEESKKTFSILVGDTVFWDGEGKVELLTKLSKDFAHYSFFNDSESEGSDSDDDGVCRV